MKARMWWAAASALAVLSYVAWSCSLGQVDGWFTRDQQGQRLFRRGEHAAAARAFVDAMWQGAAHYRAGDFVLAARCFARRNHAEAWFDQGNSWLMHGNYASAIACYDRALAKRVDWREARENRALAAARAAKLDIAGGNMTEGKLAADEVVFDGNKSSGDSQEVEVAGGGQELTGEQMQAMWLRRVQTRPAAFLKAKFAYQLATAGAAGQNADKPEKPK